MITVLAGDNSFEKEHALKVIVGRFTGDPERVDGLAIEPRHLPDLLMGITLFSDKRLVVIRDLSSNKSVWADFADWISRVSDDVHLVIVETKLDKRTKTYKELKKNADVREFNPYGERDVLKLEQWMVNVASEKELNLKLQDARLIVNRVGLDQWALYHALEKLLVVDVIDKKTIESVIDANPTENVFNLLDSALRRDVLSATRILKIIRLTEDPYRLFGLISGQFFQLLALFANHSGRDAEVAKDLGVHPYALNKLNPHIRSMERIRMLAILQAFIEADEGMKTSQAEPWLLIERAMVRVASS